MMFFHNVLSLISTDVKNELFGPRKKTKLHHHISKRPLGQHKYYFKFNKMKSLQEHERCNAIASGQRIVQASALSLLGVTHALPAYYGTNVTYDCHYVQTDIAHSLCLSLSASPTISQVIATIITTLYCEEKHRPRHSCSRNVHPALKDLV